MGLFAAKEKTTFKTPGLRAEEAFAIAEKSTGADTPDQQELVNDLARRIQVEKDPLVREALVQAMAKFPMPLADQVLSAGLRDPDAGVRQQCCKALGLRGVPTAVPQLAAVAKEDENFDVRAAATHALGDIKTPEAIQALTASLEDNDPALQYAGVQAMRKATGRDFGGNVQAYLAYARGDEAAAVAAQPQDADSGFFGRLSPF